jgi:signal transduction histidine kinase
VVQITVADQGHGISAASRDHIFAPFFTTKTELGTGLGLWVTKGMVEKHGGKIRFRSREGSRSGTVFQVLLPANGSGLARQPEAK